MPTISSPFLIDPVAAGRWTQHLARLVPGTALCGATALGGLALQWTEVQLFGRAWLESLVLAILLGVAVRTAWTPGPRWTAGIALCATLLLELAVMLMGLAIDATAIRSAGFALFAAIGAVVLVAIGVSYGLGRAFGLPHRMSVLIACGNAICGNAAIAAVAPVIEAEAREVAAAIAFTAVLGVGVVVGLPLLMVPLRLTPERFGVLAGVTVYAVPQVLAATAPAGLPAMRMGALVKLSRVMLLGPVCLGLGLLHQRPADIPVRAGGAGRPALRRLAPWFIIGFVSLAAIRILGFAPSPVPATAAAVSGGLTVVSMAALGLGVDLRLIAGAGLRVAVVGMLSLLSLGLIGLIVIPLLNLQ